MPQAGGASGETTYPKRRCPSRPCLSPWAPKLRLPRSCHVCGQLCSSRVFASLTQSPRRRMQAAPIAVVRDSMRATRKSTTVTTANRDDGKTCGCRDDGKTCPDCWRRYAAEQGLLSTLIESDMIISIKHFRPKKACITLIPDNQVQYSHLIIISSDKQGDLV